MIQPKWDLHHGHFFILHSAACFDQISIQSSNCLNQYCSTSQWLKHILAGRARAVPRVREQRRLALWSQGTWCRGNRPATGPAGSVCLSGWGLSWLAGARLPSYSHALYISHQPHLPSQPSLWLHRACLIGAAALLRARQTCSHEQQRWWLIITQPRYPECDKWECKFGNLVQSEFCPHLLSAWECFPGFHKILVSEILIIIYLFTYFISISFAWFAICLLFSLGNLEPCASAYSCIFLPSWIYLSCSHTVVRYKAGLLSF